MLRRDEDNNMEALKRYLMYRFPQIPEQFRDVIIVSAFMAAQKVALTYFDTLHEGATERSIWAKNYLRKWSHGMSTCEPVLKYPLKLHLHQRTLSSIHLRITTY